jgi:hypothetical protein
MNLNDLLRDKGIDPKHVLVMRHRPHEPELRKVLPWLAAERHDLFNAYQQTQREKRERMLKTLVGIGFVASFIGHEPGKALFVGLYAIAGAKPLAYEKFWRIPAHIEMKSLGFKGFKGWTHEEQKKTVLWFDLVLNDFYDHWKGKLVIGWPPPERVWCRRAHRNEFSVVAVLEDSALDATMPGWDAINLTWEELSVLPTRWKSALSQWRGIYYIFDSSDGKGYVGAAYGVDNILGRWLGYAKRGHGGNRLLRQRDPQSFRFTILQRVSPDMEPGDVIRLEASWKERLHTRAPLGLNDN